ncbi:MarR family winged helix-turn-helix transcriptional regulator [Vagococcus xieshaowenii]|uniref:MarR family transcriptional regulator n=1 Tax=Vagococcus xieshaowenii TaxID=2562451 RepID=A0AAJ5EEG1_9ENTE|nr:MarR family transcriptional regulator [Vagococcus xieshaowenii]QCA27961.1 MarR family transcriptional regulator [Vagococcus xieshaowenii]TFZ41271.1 MarR family transcriptional regulator [Vagococcus xieshaowenii]
MENEKLVELFFEINRLNRRYTEKKYGNLTPMRGQYRCLLALDNRGTLSQKELAEVLQIRSTSAGELIAKLEQKGYVSKKVSPNDKRVSIISLTEEGRIQAELVKKKRIEAHKEMVSILEEDEKENFYQILSKIERYYLEMEEELFE